MPDITEMAVPPVRTTGPATRSRLAGWVAAGGLAGALASISCCIVPLVLFAVGVGGAWIANLTALEPYQPIFFVATAACLVVGYFRVYRRASIGCADGACERPLPHGVVKGALWVATALVAAAIAFRYLAPLLLAAG